jgi:hypothetical protein
MLDIVNVSRSVSSRFIDQSGVVRFSESDLMGAEAGDVVRISDSGLEVSVSESLGAGLEELGVEGLQPAIVTNRRRLREKFGDDNPCTRCLTAERDCLPSELFFLYF